MAKIPGPVLGEMWKSQRVRFLIIGGFNTVFGYLVFLVLLLLIGEDSYVLIGLISHLFSTTISFGLNRTFVFGSRSLMSVAYFRFQLVYAIILGVYLVLLALLVEVLSWPVLLSQAICLPFIAIASFLGHKKFSFGH